MKLFLILLLAGVNFVQASELGKNKKRKRHPFDTRHEDFENPLMESPLEKKCLTLVNQQAINYIDTLSSDALQLCASYLDPKESLNLKKTNRNMYSFKHQNGRKIERLPITGYHNIFENTGSIQVFRNVKNGLDIKWEDPDNLIPNVKKLSFENCLRLPQLKRPNAIFDEVSKWNATEENTYKFMMKILFKLLKKVTKRNMFDFGIETRKNCSHMILMTAVNFVANGEIHPLEEVKKVVEILSKENGTILQILFGRNYLDEPFVITNVNLMYRGYTLLTYAAIKNKMEVVKILLEGGAKVDGQDTYGHTALIIAAHHGNLTMVNFLLKQNANVNLQDNGGSTALSAATLERSSLETVKVLIEADAKINVQNEDGMTALIYAAFLGDLEKVKALLEKGAKIDLQDKYGRSALMMAAEMGHFEMVKALLKAGAKANLQDNKKETSDMMAYRHGHEDIAVMINQYN